MYAWWPDSGSGAKAVNDAFAACVAGYGSHSPGVLHFGPVLNVQHESLGKYR